MENYTLQMTSVECCVCKQSDTDAVGSGKDFEYHTSDDTFVAKQCRSCSLVYLDPRPSVSEFETIYPSTYHAFDFSKKEYGFVFKVRSWLEAQRTLKRCKGLPDHARILDVGCGDGFHLKLLKEYGNKTWELEGIDLDKRAIAAAKESGITAHLGSVETIDLPDEHYDFIFMIQTIEHVEAPDKVLGAIYRLLKKGGKLVIVTDNTGSYDFNLFKKRHWGGYHFPRHWNLFNKKSLSLLGKKTGFEIPNFITIISPVNWVYSIHNWLVDHNKPQWLINRFTLKSSFSLFVFTGLDFFLQKIGKGALLQATMKKPD